MLQNDIGRVRSAGCFGSFTKRYWSREKRWLLGSFTKRYWLREKRWLLGSFTKRYWSREKCWLPGSFTKRYWSHIAGLLPSDSTGIWLLSSSPTLVAGYSFDCPASLRKRRPKCDRITPPHLLSWPCCLRFACVAVCNSFIVFRVIIVRLN